MADAERHVHSRGSLALGGRFAGRTVRFLRSRPVTDRGSVFVAHLAFPVSTEAEANAALSALKRACAGDVVDHAMSAWRVPKRGTGRGEEKRKPAARKKPMTETFFDDDGETRGGASIRAELNKLDAVGVACVVTRAYGGVNLGKKRFEHIRERVSKLVSAAGLERGKLARSDAFRGAGRAHALGGGGSAFGDSIAAALGGAAGATTSGSVSRRTDASAIDISRMSSAASAGVSAQFSRKRISLKKEAKKTLPRSVADDIRARLAEAAERRRRENAKRENAKRAGDGVVNLCDDDEPIAKRARDEYDT